MKRDDFILEYCARRSITREQYDAEGLLQQETIDALWELYKSDDNDPIIPLGLQGAGKRLSALTEAEREALHMNQIEFDELMPGSFFPDDPDVADENFGDPRRRGWVFGKDPPDDETKH